MDLGLHWKSSREAHQDEVSSCSALGSLWDFAVSTGKDLTKYRYLPESGGWKSGSPECALPKWPSL